MLAGLRNDSIPVAYKERHTVTVTRDMFRPKPVFDKWKKDDHEVLKRCFDYDMKMVPTEEITKGDKVDALQMMRTAMTKFSHLKDVYHYLQSMSRSYPRIDLKTLKEKFILKLNIDVRAINMNKVEV